MTTSKRISGDHDPPHASGCTRRMWVDGSMPGIGLRRRLLAAFEGLAPERGCVAVQLETHGALQAAPPRYRKGGYREVEPFNDKLRAHHWCEQELEPPGYG